MCHKIIEVTATKYDVFYSNKHLHGQWFVNNI